MSWKYLIFPMYALIYMSLNNTLNTFFTHTLGGVVGTCGTNGVSNECIIGVVLSVMTDLLHVLARGPSDW